MSFQGDAPTGGPGRNEPKSADYIDWECLPPGGPLNRWSHTITKDHDYPGAQVRGAARTMLLELGGTLAVSAKRNSLPESLQAHELTAAIGFVSCLDDVADEYSPVQGDALWSWSPESGYDEKCTSGGHCHGVVVSRFRALFRYDMIHPCLELPTQGQPEKREAWKLYWT